jgi:YD repeat-containing protein
MEYRPLEGGKRLELKLLNPSAVYYEYMLVYNYNDSGARARESTLKDCKIQRLEGNAWFEESPSQRCPSSNLPNYPFEPPLLDAAIPCNNRPKDPGKNFFLGDAVNLSTLTEQRSTVCAKIGVVGNPIRVGLHYAPDVAAIFNEGDDRKRQRFILSYSRKLKRSVSWPNAGATDTIYRLMEESGDIHTWVENGTSIVPASALNRATLTLSSSGQQFILTYPSGAVDKFNVNTGDLEWAADKSGQILEFQRTYNATALSELRIRNTTTNEVAVLTYSTIDTSTWGVTSIRESLPNNPSGGRIATFGYAGQNLTSYTDMSGRVWSYGYDAESRVKTFTDPLGNTTSQTYALPTGNRVKTEQLADGTLYNFNEVASQPWDLEVTKTKNGTTRALRYLRNINGQIVREYLPNSTSAFKTTVYGTDGQIASVVDEQGRKTEFLYSAPGIVSSARRYKTASSYDETSFLTDAFSNITQINAPDQPTQAMEYLGPGRALSKMTVAGTRQITIAYAPVNINGQAVSLGDLPTSVTLPDGTVNRTTYDSNGFPNILTLDANGLAITEDFDYDARGFLISHLNQQGIRTNYEYANNPTLGQFGNLGIASAEEFDVGGRNVRTEYTFDAALNLIKEIRDAGAGRLNATTLMEYSLVGADMEYAMTKLTDAEGNVTNFSYTAFGELASRSIANGLGAGRNLTKQYRYTPEGWLDYALMNDGTTKSVDYDYNAAGDVTKVTDARGVTSIYEYDGKGRLGRLLAGTTVVDGQPAINGEFLYTYDGADRLKKVDQSYSAGYTRVLVSRTYDGFGNLDYEEDGENRRTDYSYDVMDRLTGVDRGTSGNIIKQRFTYDKLGRMLAQTNGEGADAELTRFEYAIAGSPDRWNRRKMIDPNNNSTRYQYDVFGEVSSVVDAAHSGAVNGITTTTRNNLGYLTGTKTPGNSTPVFYIPDRLSRTTELRHGSRTQTWDYLPSGLLRQSKDFANRLTTREYNALGYLASIDRVGSNADASFDYFPNGLLRVATSKPNGITDESTVYAYDAVNRMRSSTRNGRTQTFGYNQADATTIDYFGLGNVGYSRDLSGKITSVGNLSQGSTTFSYSSNGALELSQIWTPNTVQQWRKRVVNSAGRQIQSGVVNITSNGQILGFDTSKSVITTYEGGRVKTRDSGAAGVKGNFSYDVLNRMLQWVK